MSAFVAFALAHHAAVLQHRLANSNSSLWLAGGMQHGRRSSPHDRQARAQQQGNTAPGWRTNESIWRPVIVKLEDHRSISRVSRRRFEQQTELDRDVRRLVRILRAATAPGRRGSAAPMTHVWPSAPRACAATVPSLRCSRRIRGAVLRPQHSWVASSTVAGESSAGPGGGRGLFGGTQCREALPLLTPFE